VILLDVHLVLGGVLIFWSSHRNWRLRCKSYLQEAMPERTYLLTVGIIALIFIVSMTIPLASILIGAVLPRHARWKEIVLVSSLGSATGGNRRLAGADAYETALRSIPKRVGSNLPRIREDRSTLPIENQSFVSSGDGVLSPHFRFQDLTQYQERYWPNTDPNSQPLCVGFLQSRS
jgi:hypothetical protein